jgi:hypothetical protein
MKLDETMIGTHQIADFTRNVGVPIVVTIGALATSVGVAAITFILGKWSDTIARRRDGYAAATRQLVAWAEYPYRIRRRCSDDADTLTKLTERGHSFQEALRYRETWIRSENRWVAHVFAAVRVNLGTSIGNSCNEAWATKPIDQAKDMTLTEWGPGDVDIHIRRFERAAAFRFGWRRIPAIFRWHPGA